MTANMDEEVRRRAKQVLDKASALASTQGITSLDERREGRAAKEVLKAVDRRRCDRRIIGSRGLSVVSRMIPGEAGQEVALNAPMPVVVAK